MGFDEADLVKKQRAAICTTGLGGTGSRERALLIGGRSKPPSNNRQNQVCRAVVTATALIVVPIVGNASRIPLIQTIKPVTQVLFRSRMLVPVGEPALRDSSLQQSRSESRLF
jgi:hypothetical protein